MTILNIHTDFKTYPDFRVVKMLKIFILGFRVYTHDKIIEPFTNIFKAELLKIENWCLNKCLKLGKHLSEVYWV